jgi:hypothetical protein
MINSIALNPCRYIFLICTDYRTDYPFDPVDRISYHFRISFNFRSLCKLSKLSAQSCDVTSVR